MKKNKLMRLASVLLVLTLLTTCVIGGTYAKYITSDSAHDVARVAKFGVVASVSGDLFGPSYTMGDSKATAGVIQKWAVNAESVSAYAATAETADNLVAPGTKNDKGLDFVVKGTPEVSTTVSFGRAMSDTGIDAALYPATVELASNASGYGVMVPYDGVITKDTITNYFTKTNDAFTKVSTAADPVAGTVYYELHDSTGAVDANYLPIVWIYEATNTGDSVSISSTESRDLKTVFTGIQGAFNGKTRTPNTSNDMSANLKWRWNFEDDDYSTTASDGTRTPAGSVYSNVDRRDTILGDMIALDSGKLNDNQYVVKMTSATAGSAVKLATVPVKDGASNSVTIAYTGADEPSVAYTGDILESGAIDTANGVCAVLGVAFNASLTVQQVD